MILKKINPTADVNNAVYLSELQDPILDQAAVTLTKYSVAFTNSAAVATVEIGGVTYTPDANIDISDAEGCQELVAYVESVLHSLGYQWDGEHPIHYELDGATTNLFTPFSQIVFDQINATAFVVGDTTEYGLS